MAVKPCSLRIDMRQHEIEHRGTPMFPCGAYTVTVGGHITECIPWHWHEHVEVLLVASGALKLDVPNHCLTLREGEAAFVNASVLHCAVNAENSVCEVKSIVFDPKFIYGSLESAIAQKYVQPLVNAPQLGALHFGHDLHWHKDAIHCVEEAYARCQDECYGYEMLARESLSSLWYLIVLNKKDELERHQRSQNTESVRMKEMLGHIHANYAQAINLKGIAESAAISDRECLRCFHNVMGTTPMKYLLNYRVSVAAGLLSNSDLSITEISRLSGFESPSYFSQKFKALTDMTPREYREHGKKTG